MDFRMLGALEVEREGRLLPLGGAKERALLALLLLHANEVVSRDALVDGLWRTPPPSATHTLEVYVSRLRKALEASQARIVTQSRGYRLEVDPNRIDLNRFERLAAEGRESLTAGDVAAAEAMLREALSLWHGESLAGLTSEPFLELEAERLEEMRLSVLEDAIDAGLALGRHRELVAELEALVGRHPHRERLSAQLMLALYRSGRQAEALALYKRTRSLLVGELGIEPDRQLLLLEQAILQHDPRLDLELGPAPETPSASRGRPGRRRRLPLRYTRLHLGLVAALVAVAAAAAVILTRAESRGRAPPLVDNGVAIVDPTSGGLVRVLPLPFAPGEIAADEHAVWVTGPSEGTVVRVAPDVGAVVQTVKAGSVIGGVALGGGAVWASEPAEGKLARIDTASGQVVQRIDLGTSAAGVAFGYGSVWVAEPDARTVSRIDPATGRVLATVDTQVAGWFIATGEGGVWVADELEAVVVEIDPRRNAAVRAINVGNGPAALAAGDGSLWVANGTDGTVSRVDPVASAVRSTVGAGAGPMAIAVSPDAVWVAGETSKTLVRIDPWNGTVSRTIVLPGRPTGIALQGERLVVSLASGSTVHRGGVVHVSALAGWIDSIDPSRAQSLGAWTLLASTGDGLVGFRRVGGVDSERLTPDLAVALPRPTAAGTTYTFRLRRGIRFSTGAVLEPSDVRYTIERLFRARSPAVGLFTTIVGGSRCAAAPAGCRLTQGIVADDRAGTVTFRLVERDPLFLHKLALPYAYVVPAGTPLPRSAQHLGAGAPEQPVPATGPYRVAAYEPDQSVRLVRNRWFRPWSRAARPDGFPDEIDVSLLSPTSEHAAALIEGVEQGRSDVAAVPGNAPNMEQHRLRYPSRLHPMGASAGPVGEALHFPPRDGGFIFVAGRVRNYEQSRIFGPLLDQLWVR